MRHAAAYGQRESKKRALVFVSVCVCVLLLHVTTASKSKNQKAKHLKRFLKKKSRRPAAVKARKQRKQNLKKKHELGLLRRTLYLSPFYRHVQIEKKKKRMAERRIQYLLVH